MKKGPTVQAIGIFWVKPGDYSRYLEICADREKLPATYEKWLYSANKGVETLQRQRVPVYRAVVDLDQFIAWCNAKGLAIDSKARLEYASYIAFSLVRANDANKH
jgi:hypothetical protein